MFDQIKNSPPVGAESQIPIKVIRFNKNYWKTLPGILKLVQMVCNIVGFICVKITYLGWLPTIFYITVYWVGNIVTTFLFIMYTFYSENKYDQWPWHKLEFFYCSAISLAYIGISVSLFAMTIRDIVEYFVEFFAICAIIAYGLDAYFKYKEWKRPLPPCQSKRDSYTGKY